ncbi:MAG: SulP family inorganic anion transporter [Cytophaga sp.]|uniref:SulP family inorganic anion transporter n=1 Tax=Cytophaga sp. TaxID=29535 RepID=UPI003F7D67EF
MLSIKESLQNIQSGVVVFLVAIPLCLGIAIAQNAPPFSGIISGIIGGSIVMLISGAKYSISGPTAGMTAIMITSIKELGGFEFVLTAICIAGVFQILFGVLRVGLVGHYFPSSVIKGMLSAIGIILIIKQIPHLVGYDVDPEGNMSFFQDDGKNTFSELVHMLNYFSAGPAIISAISILILLFWNGDFIKPGSKLSFIPSALVIVIAGILMNLLFQHIFPSLIVHQSHLVSIPSIKSPADLIDSLIFPDFSALQNYKTYSIGFTIAVVISLESLLSIDAMDKLKKATVSSPPNRELIAQGVGNLSCGLVGGVPITSAIIRSSANINAGATNKLSGYVHGFLLLTSILLFPSLLTSIPNASLAVILLFTGYKLTKMGLYKSMYLLGQKQFLPFITTISMMLLTDMLKGILCGLAVAVFYIIRDMIRIPIKKSSVTIDNKVHTLIKFPENVSFINKGVLFNMLQTVPPDSSLILDGSNIKSIDYDVSETITVFKQDAHKKGIHIQMINIKEIDLHLHK